MALTKIDISMLEDIPAPGSSGQVIKSDGTNWTSGADAGLPAVGADGQVLTSDGTNWASEAAPGGGKILQIVAPTPNNTQTVLTTSWQDVGGATVTITPSLTTSKVLFMLSTGGFLQGSNGVEIELLRDSTRVMHQTRFAYSQSINQSSWSYSTMNMSLHYIDSPSSTSAIVYKIRMKTQVNPVEAEVNSQNGGAGTNSMTVTAMEIGV